MLTRIEASWSDAVTVEVEPTTEPESSLMTRAGIVSVRLAHGAALAVTLPDGSSALAPADGSPVRFEAVIGLTVLGPEAPAKHTRALPAVSHDHEDAADGTILVSELRAVLEEYTDDTLVGIDVLSAALDRSQELSAAPGASAGVTRGSAPEPEYDDATVTVGRKRGRRAVLAAAEAASAPATAPASGAAPGAPVPASAPVQLPAEPGAPSPAPADRVPAARPLSFTRPVVSGTTLAATPPEPAPEAAPEQARAGAPLASAEALAVAPPAAQPPAAASTAATPAGAPAVAEPGHTSAGSTTLDEAEDADATTVAPRALLRSGGSTPQGAASSPPAPAEPLSFAPGFTPPAPAAPSVEPAPPAPLAAPAAADEDPDLTTVVSRALKAAPPQQPAQPAQAGQPTNAVAPAGGHQPASEPASTAPASATAPSPQPVAAEPAAPAPKAPEPEDPDLTTVGPRGLLSDATVAAAPRALAAPSGVVAPPPAAGTAAPGLAPSGLELAPDVDPDLTTVGRRQQRAPRVAPAHRVPPAPTPLPAAEEHGTRLLVQDAHGTRDVPLAGTIVIGRTPSPAQVRERDARGLVVVPTGTGVSHSHAAIRRQGSVVLVRDLWSTNGTRVRSAGVPPFRLRDGEEVPVSDGTVVELGDGVVITIVERGES
ncbi:FHA domain-containing protein [Galactobacter valiniphilus]|uniref:FHA domain-containing protein n=1 Tax=Galactobacter valiniphilus TaxID=2676122 RepID=UPI0011C45D6C|nr:FHA domain-containing protein [Galactobacter valiniphilus]